MRLLALVFILLFASACSAATHCGNYTFYGTVKFSKSQKFYLQVFPGDRRMYRLRLSGKKLKWAPFLNRSVEFSGDWSGVNSDPIGVTSKVKVTKVSNLNLPPAKLEKVTHCL